MMNSVLPERVRIPDEVIFQEIDNECVLLNMANEQYFGLNDVGARMWRLLVDGGNPRAALAQLQTYYEADETTLKEDLAGFISRLQTESLLDVDR